MKKNSSKLISVILCIMLIISSVSIFSFAAQSKLTYKLSDYGAAELVSCAKNASGAITVDQTVTIDGKEYTVKIIGDNAFEGCSKITSITIPEGVTVIGAKAFASCESLTTVNLPSTLVSCSYDAFNDDNTVTVNCYTSNYQFFTVVGFADNVKINVVDSTIDQEQTESVNNVIAAIRKFIKMILSWFGISI